MVEYASPMMINSFVKILPFVLIILYLVAKIKFKLKIKWKTFFKKGIHAKRGIWGTYTFYAPQGKFKTMSIMTFVHEHPDYYYFSNIPNLNVDAEVEYINGFKGIIDVKNRLDLDRNFIHNKQVVFIYDELFQELIRGRKLSEDIVDFMTQMRKRKIIFLTTCQSWSDIPIEFRHFCRYAIECNGLTLPTKYGCSFFINKYIDAENMVWDEKLQDHVGPLVKIYVRKVLKVVANSYNTFALIKSNQVGGLEAVTPSNNKIL